MHKNIIEKFSQNEYKTIAMGNRAGSAIRKDGSVVTWGRQDFVNTEDLNNIKSIVSGGDGTIALKNDGTLVTWGGITNPNLTNVKSISYGSFQYQKNSAIALKNDGTIYCWGNPIHETINSKNLTNIKEAHMLDKIGYVIKEDNSAETWGYEASRPEIYGVDLTNVKTICSSYRGTAREGGGAVLYNNGSVITFGNATNIGSDYTFSDGFTSGLPEGSLRNIKQICMTISAGAALTNNGDVLLWGKKTTGGVNNSGVDLTNVKKIFAGLFAFAALKNDGTIVTWGGWAGGDYTFSGTPEGMGSSVVLTGVSASDMTDIVDISMGGFGGIALKSNGTALTWGRRNLGGDSSFVDLSNIKLPGKKQQNKIKKKAQYKSIKTDKTISMGYNQGGVIHTNGTFTTWGYENTYSNNRLKVIDAKSITIGSNAGAILRESNSNSVVAWGDSILGGKIRTLGEDGRITSGNEIKLDDITKISIGNDTGISLKNDGTIFTWGLYTNTYFFDDSIKNLSDVKDVKINYNTGIVIKNDNTAVTWSRLNQDTRPENSSISLRNVKSIVTNEYAGIVLYLDGTAITYGKSEHGGKYNYIKPIPTITPVLNYEITIENDVEEITKEIFDEQLRKYFTNKESITSIIIPDSVTGIGDEAFVGCINLTSVTIGNGVTRIGDSAFAGCRKLVDVKMGNSIKTIGYEAFKFCYDLASIEIPESVTTINNRAFFYCMSLKSIKIPSGVNIPGGSHTFQGCECDENKYVAGATLCNCEESSNWPCPIITTQAPTTSAPTTSAPTTGDNYNIIGIESGSLKNIKQVCMTKGAGAALTNDGNVLIWGNDTVGGLNNTNSDLTNVKQLFSGGNAFAALKNDNTVVTWGKINSGGDFKYSGPGPKIQVRRNSEQETTVIGLNESDLTDIVDVSMGEYAGMALKKNGDVLTWGVKNWGATENVIKNVRLPYIENIPGENNNNNNNKSNVGMIILFIFLVILGIFILLFALQYFGVINIKFIQKIIKRPV